MAEKEKKGFFKRLFSGLEKTRNSIASSMNSIFSGFSSIDDDFYEELEEVLIMADMGIHTTENILDSLKEKVKILNFMKKKNLKKRQKSGTKSTQSKKSPKSRRLLPHRLRSRTFLLLSARAATKIPKPVFLFCDSRMPDSMTASISFLICPRIFPKQGTSLSEAIIQCVISCREEFPLTARLTAARCFRNGFRHWQAEK